MFNKAQKEEIKKLREDYATLELRLNSLTWLFQHPTGISYSVVTDFVKDAALSLDYSLQVSYFNSKTKIVENRDLVHSLNRAIVNPEIHFDMDKGDLTVTFIRASKQDTKYKYTTNLYRNNAPVDLYMWEGSTWIHIPIFVQDRSDRSYSTIFI